MSLVPQGTYSQSLESPGAIRIGGINGFNHYIATYPTEHKAIGLPTHPANIVAASCFASTHCVVISPAARVIQCGSSGE